MEINYFIFALIAVVVSYGLGVISGLVVGERVAREVIRKYGK